MMTYNAETFGGKTCAEFIAMLQAEGIPCSPGYRPLNQMPALRRALAEQAGQIRSWEQGPQEAVDTNLPELPECPVTEDLCQRTIWLKQTMLLGDHEDMDDIASAIRKIQDAVA
jgi:hypothetical protein